jgi:hypothetical protein
MQGLLQKVMGAGIIAKGQDTPEGRMSRGRNHKQFLAIILLEAKREICAKVFICNAITSKISIKRPHDDSGFSEFHWEPAARNSCSSLQQSG